MTAVCSESRDGTSAAAQTWLPHDRLGSPAYDDGTDDQVVTRSCGLSKVDDGNERRQRLGTIGYGRGHGSVHGADEFRPVMLTCASHRVGLDCPIAQRRRPNRSRPKRVLDYTDGQPRRRFRRVRLGGVRATG